ncbi:MAG TPA: DegT/DnrJ/EryC1/StrS family aminotransferase [Bryobacteraceae bacterium]|jgi:dTDP-4-amino-4,6-dideoxygalactose transaminase|nr:DegT/DnrJ/EryC1/StrS family aminotransferase [Bryobacteraceae bacterium]
MGNQASADQSFIAFHRPSIGEEEIREVEATLRSGWLTTGPRTAQFEEDFAKYVNARCAIAVNSATAGLHVALAALGIGEGDEVITTPLTFCSTVHTILHVGAKPILADIGPDGNIDPEEVAKAITPRTRAIIPVHLAGLPCEMRPIWDLARKHGLFVIEDAAHAAGADYEGVPIGASPRKENEPASDAVVFSFYATKNLTTGEGGMITTGSQQLAHTMRMLTLHGMSRDAWNRYTERGSWYYEVVARGFKYNLSDLQSAIGIHQLRKLESFIATRQRYVEIYNRVLGEVAEVEIPRDRPGSRHAWHLYMLRLNLDRLRIDRYEFIEDLRRLGIGASVHFIPIPRHPYFGKMSLGEQPCRRALELYPRLVSLPLYPAMTEEQVLYVANAVKDLACSSRAPARTLQSMAV